MGRKKNHDAYRIVVRLTLERGEHDDIIAMLENAKYKGQAIVNAIRATKQTVTPIEHATEANDLSGFDGLLG